MGCEVARHPQSRTGRGEFERAFAAIGQVRRITSVPHGAIARHHVQASRGIRSHAGPAFPHAPRVSVGSVIVDYPLLHGLSVVSQYPSMIRAPVAVG